MPKYTKIQVTRLSPDKVDQFIKLKEVLILDVRPENFSRNNYFLENTVLMPLLHIEEMAVELPKDKAILITDWAMKQSPIAAKFLISENFTVVGVLKGGIERWKHENRPTVQKSSPSSGETENRDFR